MKTAINNLYAFYMGIITKKAYFITVCICAVICNFTYPFVAAYDSFWFLPALIINVAIGLSFYITDDIEPLRCRMLGMSICVVPFITYDCYSLIQMERISSLYIVVIGVICFSVIIGVLFVRFIPGKYKVVRGFFYAELILFFLLLSLNCVFRTLRYFHTNYILYKVEYTHMMKNQKKIFNSIENTDHLR